MSTALWKLPCIAAFTYANYVIWTPTNTSKPQERVKAQSLSERWIQVEIAGLGLIKNTFLVMGLVESVAILADALDIAPGLSQQLLLTGDASKLQLDTASILGLAFVVAGTWLRYVCYNTMGRHYTFELSIRKGHQLVKNGPYSVVRHPGLRFRSKYLLDVRFGGIEDRRAYRNLRSTFRPESWWKIPGNGSSGKRGSKRGSQQEHRALVSWH